MWWWSRSTCYLLVHSTRILAKYASLNSKWDSIDDDAHTLSSVIVHIMHRPPLTHTHTTANRWNNTGTVVVSFLFLLRLIYNISFRKLLCLSKIVGCACMRVYFTWIWYLIFSISIIKMTISLPLPFIFNNFTICGNQQIADDLQFAFHSVLHNLLNFVHEWNGILMKWCAFSSKIAYIHSYASL